MALVVRVAIADIVEKIDKPYDYICRIPVDDPVGRRALVPFGNADTPRKCLIVDKFETDDVSNLKTLITFVDDAPVVDSERIDLLFFLKERYFITLYGALKCLLPPAMDPKIRKQYSYAGGAYDEKYRPVVDFCLKKKKPVAPDKFPADLIPLVRQAIDDGVLSEVITSSGLMGDLSEKMISLAVPPEQADGYICDLPKRYQAQADILAMLIDTPIVSVKELMYMTGCGLSSVKTLEKKGLITLFRQSVPREPYGKLPKKIDHSAVPLNAEQQKVVDDIIASMDKGASTHLLFGVTGSGKTNVYMSLIRQTLSRGKSAMFLVPEISLTPQTLSRFYARFGDEVAVIHSGLSRGQRLDEWKKIRDGKARIVVGTRSAVFAPVKNLGIIIMDEEHEASYKSEAAPRFHARDIAKYLCARFLAPLVLGSATPCIESYRAAETGKYILHTLKTRVNHQPLPTVEMVDMREEEQSEGLPVISASLREKIQKAVDHKKQVILFLNRRGAHTMVACRKCGYVLRCPNCGITMTYHSANQRCICHFCSYSVPAVRECPQCKDRNIRMSGVGVQHVEEKLREMFPQVGILRMDMDTVTGYISYHTKLDDFARGKYQILLGTQMVAKGLDFPNVTLVGVLQADQSLYFEDFRAGERTFSLLTQVCGRSGRSEDAGTAVIQTYCPDHEVLRYAKEQDYLSFYKYEIAFRKAVTYPPFCDLALFSIFGKNADLAMDAAKALFSSLEKHAATDAADIPLRLLRPTVPKIERINEKYRTQLIVKCKNSKKLRDIIRCSMAEIRQKFSVNINVDLYPVTFF